VERLGRLRKGAVLDDRGKSLQQLGVHVSGAQGENAGGQSGYARLSAERSARPFSCRGR
jgi:hypothetical protein